MAARGIRRTVRGLLGLVVWLCSYASGCLSRIADLRNSEKEIENGEVIAERRNGSRRPLSLLDRAFLVLPFVPFPPYHSPSSPSDFIVFHISLGIWVGKFARPEPSGQVSPRCLLT